MFILGVKLYCTPAEFVTELTVRRPITVSLLSRVSTLASVANIFTSTNIKGYAKTVVNNAN